MNQDSKSLTPVIGNEPRVLILGTLPGKESLRLNQYYANPRNLFWKIIYDIFLEQPDSDYGKKTQFAKLNKIAIWDVCEKAVRKTSLDSDIKNEKPNKINKLLKEYPSIKRIVFNGRKAEKLYDRYFNRFRYLEYYTFLSTSPANTRHSYEAKFNCWKFIVSGL